MAQGLDPDQLKRCSWLNQLYILKLLKQKPAWINILSTVSPVTTFPLCVHSEGDVTFVVGSTNYSYQHLLNMLPTLEWAICRENMGMRANIGLYLGKKWGLCGRIVEMGNRWAACV